MTSKDGWKITSQIHDEVSYEWSPDADDITWARDSNGVVHVWYKAEGSEGFAECDVPREDIQQFFVAAVDVTCITCLATKGSIPSGAIKELQRKLAASLQVPVKYLGSYAPGDAAATLEVTKKLQDLKDKIGYVPTLKGRKRRLR